MRDASRAGAPLLHTDCPRDTRATVSGSPGLWHASLGYGMYTRRQPLAWRERASQSAW